MNVSFGWGEIGGSALTPGGDFAEGGPQERGGYGYTQVKSLLIAAAHTANAIAADASLPASSPNGVSSYFLSNAQQKALGLLSATGTELDGEIGFATGWTSNWVGGALHELTHALGRDFGDGQNVMDLFRYAAPGVRQVVGGDPAYFSIDGGTTDLANYGQTSDDGDFANNAPTQHDPFDETISAQSLTPVDVELLNVIGFGVPGSGVQCFRAGTRIATPDGERRVESLAVGDRVTTASGRARSIVWVGRRTIDCARHPNPAAVRPVRVAAGAFGPGRPVRDLFLSPDHAVFVGGALVPIKHLIDGDLVRQVAARSVTYVHIELDAHDVVLAEGMPAESYLDVGDRDAFDGGVTISLFPVFGAGRESARWEAFGCAPLAVCGPAVERARAALARRATSTRRAASVAIAAGR